MLRIATVGAIVSAVQLQRVVMRCGIEGRVDSNEEEKGKLGENWSSVVGEAGGDHCLDGA